MEKKKRNPKSKEATLKETREKEMVAVDMLSFISQSWTEPGNSTLILWKVVLFAIQRKKKKQCYDMFKNNNAMICLLRMLKYILF